MIDKGRVLQLTAKVHRRLYGDIITVTRDTICGGHSTIQHDEDSAPIDALNGSDSQEVIAFSSSAP